MPTPNLAVPAEDPSATRASPVDDAEVPQYYSQQLPNASPALPAQLSELSKPGLPRGGGGAANGECVVAFSVPVLWLGLLAQALSPCALALTCAGSDSLGPKSWRQLSHFVEAVVRRSMCKRMLKAEFACRDPKRPPCHFDLFSYSSHGSALDLIKSEHCFTKVREGCT